MPSELWPSPFRAEQAGGSKYPFADDATLVADSGFALDPDLVIDAILHPLGATADLSLTRVERSPGLVNLRFGNPANPLLATATLVAGDTYDRAALADAYQRPAGLLVLDPIRAAGLWTWTEGTHTFAAGAAPLVARCVVPWPDPGVTGVAVGTALLTDDVWLVGGPGVLFRRDGDLVRLDVVGDPLFRRATCAGTPDFGTRSFLRTLVVEDDAGHRFEVGPDAFGQIALVPTNRSVADTVLRIVPRGTDLVIEAVGGG
jgi:hypothetical protein